MSLEQFQLLAYAAGFSAVSEDDIDIERAVPPDDSVALARTGTVFVPGWHMPDAPAPRTALAAPQISDHSRALTVVEPLWLSVPAPAAANSSGWAQHLTSVARSMSAYIPGRSMPA
jgi:hypothetical protein